MILFLKTVVNVVMEVSLCCLLQLCWVSKTLHFYFITREIIWWNWCSDRRWIVLKFKLGLEVLCYLQNWKNKNTCSQVSPDRGAQRFNVAEDWDDVTCSCCVKLLFLIRKEKKLWIRNLSNGLLRTNANKKSMIYRGGLWLSVRIGF